MKSLSKYILTLSFIGLAFASSAQICGTTAELCEKHLAEDGFITDGQSYRVVLQGNQTTEFYTTLYPGTTYRVSAYGNESEGNLIYSLLDQEGNVLFSNGEYSNASYWDFRVDSKIDVSIKSQLDLTRVSSGCAVIILGFKEGALSN